MKIATVNLPVPYIEALQKLVDNGLYHSRSQVIRECVKEFLAKEPGFMREIMEVVKCE